MDKNEIELRQSQEMNVEEARSVAEIQGQMVMAKKFPRSYEAYMPRILEACDRKIVAEGAEYAYPKGGQMVTGPSIRLAEVMAQNYGNLDFGIRELSQGNGKSHVQSYCFDLETNVRSQKAFWVSHLRVTKQGKKVLTDPRDIYEVVANNAARRLRNCILAVIPQDVTQQARDRCNKTLTGDGKVPIKDVIVKMVQTFKDDHQVSAEMIEKRLGHKIQATNHAEIVTLGKIHNSLRDGMAKRGDFFAVGGQDDPGVEGLKGALKEDKGAPAVRPKATSTSQSNASPVEPQATRTASGPQVPTETTLHPNDAPLSAPEHIQDPTPTHVQDGGMPEDVKAQIQQSLGRPLR